MHFITRFSFSLLLGIITINFNRGLCEKATSRAIDLSVAWRPLPAVQNSPSSGLISVTSLDNTNKAELLKIAQHNAHIMRQIKGLTPPSTQYYNSYQSSTPSYHLHHHAAIQQQQNQQQKNNFGKPQFVGKPEYSNYYVNGIHSSTPKIPGLMKNMPQQYAHHYQQQQQQHQLQQQQQQQYQQQQQKQQQQQYSQGSFISLSTTAKYRDVSLTPPPKPQPTPKSPLQTSQHPVINKLQEHLALVTRQNKQPSVAQSIRLENFAIPESVLSSFSHFSPPVLKSNSYSSNSINAPVKHFYGNNFESLSNNQYLPPSGPNGNTAESFVFQNLKNNGNSQFKISFQNTIREQTGFTPPFPSIPPSVLSPFFQQVQQQQAGDTKYQGYKTNTNNVEYTTYSPPKDQQIKVEINDEFTRNLVPPPHYKHTDSNNFRDIVNAKPNEDKANFDYFNKYNVQNVSPLQDANRFSYNSGSYKPASNGHQISSSSAGLSSTTPSNTYADYLFPPSTDPPIDFNTFITTERPNVFKHLSRPQESEYKQHKLMHPSYTGAKHPNDNNQHDTTFLPTSNNPDHDNNAITHSFFTIEDAVTVVPSQTILTGSLSPNNQFIPNKNYQYEVEHFSHKDVKETNIPKQTQSHDEKLETPVSEEVEDVYQNHFIASTMPPSTTAFVYTTPEQVITTTTRPTTTTPTSEPQTLPPIPSSQQPQFSSIRPRDRTKLRRRRPRPRPTAVVDDTVDNDLRTIQPTYEVPVQTSVQSANPQRNRINRRPPTTITENTPITSVYQPVQRHRRPAIQHVEQYLIETSPSPQTIRQRPQQPQISTTQQSKPTHFLPTILTDSVSLNSERVKTTNLIPDETTIDIRPQTQFNRVRNPTTITYEDYSVPQTTNEYQQGNDVVLDTTISNVPAIEVTPTIENIGTEHVRHLGRFRYKENKLTTPIEEYNDNETAPPLIRIHTKLSTVRPTTTTTTQKPITTTTTTESTPSKSYGRVKSQYDTGNRPRFSVKEYRQKLHTTTTELPISGDSLTQTTHNRLRFPSRTRFVNDINRIRQRGEISTTETSIIQNNNIEEEEIAAPVETSTETRKRVRQRPTTEPTTSTTNRPTSPRRGINTRRDFVNRSRVPTSTQRIITDTPTIRNVSIALRRPSSITLRQRIQNFRKKEEKLVSPNDIVIDDTKPPIDDSLTEEQNHIEQIVEVAASPKSEQTSTDGYRHETSIMKIAKDDHSYRQHPTESSSKSDHDTNDLSGSPSDYSQRVAELTISGNNAFKSVNTGILPRRVPGYFTLATDDPILPIEAFFPQVKKD